MFGVWRGSVDMFGDGEGKGHGVVGLMQTTD